MRRIPSGMATGNRRRPRKLWRCRCSWRTAAGVVRVAVLAVRAPLLTSRPAIAVMDFAKDELYIMEEAGQYVVPVAEFTGQGSRGQEPDELEVTMQNESQDDGADQHAVWKSNAELR